MTITLADAKNMLDVLSPERTQSAIDFISYLYECEVQEANAELETKPGLKKHLDQALERVKTGDYVRYEDIHHHVSDH